MMRVKIFLTFFTFFCLGCKDEYSLLDIEDSGTLPKLEITIDENYLWSPDSGLYVIGINGTELCGPVANYNQKWEFPASVKYTDNNNTIFDENIGLRIKGNCSRVSSMKSFGLYWRNKYGNNKLEYPIFSNSNVGLYKRLFVRNSGNDFGETQIHDISIISVIKDYANVEFQEYLQCVVYLNEEYWGIYNLREMITKHHFEFHFGYDKGNIDLLEGSELNPIADDGNTESYLNNVIGFIENNDLSLDYNYDHIKSIIDIDSYIDYIIVNTYIGNRDWPINNSKWWKDRTSNNSKWRWVIFDTDLSFYNSKVEQLWIGSLIGGNQNNNDAFFIFNNLIRNTYFKDKFLNRYLFFINNVFEKSRVASLITLNKNRIDREYTNFHQKWDVLSKSSWENRIDKLIEFNNQRNDIMRKIIQNLLNEPS